MILHSRKNLRLLGGVILATLLMATSCGSPKRYAYMQNVEQAKLYSVEHPRLLVVEPGDRLQISVQSAYPELAAPFNGYGFPIVSTPGLTGSSSSNIAQSATDANAMRSYGYSVDEQGMINFPVLGQIKVAGLTLEGVSKHLEQRIKDSKYVTDPRVDVMFANFQIYMLGASKPEGAGVGTSTYSLVNGQYASFTPINTIGGGVLRISDKKELSILEALAYMGDLPVNANVEKVNVIRRINGQFVTYRLNMKSVDIYNSPAFYLKQNDIVYVEPLYRRSDNEGVERIMQLSGYALSSIASIVAVVALFRKN